MRLLKWIIYLPIIILLIIFAVSNRQGVSLELWPLPFSLEAPLFLVTLVLLAIGILLGHLISWMQRIGQHDRSRHDKRKIDELEKEVDTLHKRIELLSKEKALTNKSLSPPKSGS